MVKEENLLSAFFEKYGNIQETKSSLFSCFTSSHFFIYANIKS